MPMRFCSKRSATDVLMYAWFLSGGAAVLWATGCQSLAGAIVGLQGGDIIEAHYELTDGPLLVMFDDRSARVERPEALRSAHSVISDLFSKYRVNSRVVPYSEMRRFQQQEDRYSRLTIREIGERLGAEEVLYVGVEKFTVQAQEGAPIFQGLFEARVKVISTERTNDVRKWPREGAGHRIAVETNPTPMDGDVSESAVATELGEKMGEKVAKLFYEHRENE